jgi:MoaA/NifB/PqqE/SkfB family radical SAM enzyme
MGNNNFVRNLVLKQVSKSLTGKSEDLQTLVEITKNQPQTQQDPAIKNFVDSLETSLNEGTNFSKIFLRVGQETSKSYKKNLVRNLILNQFIEGKHRRRAQDYEDNVIPNMLVISPTMRCNLNCTGCYSGLYEKHGDLSEEELDRVIGEARDMGIYFIVISGGEPYLLKDALLRIFKKYNDMFFLTYTNGTFLDKKTTRKLKRLGNVAPAISVEGWEAETDQRRGKGMWNKINEAMSNLRKAGVLFGISVTYTRHNIDVVTDDKFIEHFINKGAIFGWYFMFMPVGKDPILDLVPTPEQRVYTGDRVEQMRKKYPVFLADFWNDGDAVSGCLAGGRQYLHILNSGSVEPCVFVHFGVDNIREKPLKDIVNSDFFKSIRREFPYNEDANLKRPCMIIDNPNVLRKVVRDGYVKYGHDHSEDIIKDPNVVEWVDNYAEEYRKLRDPEWQRRINDPNDRWYKEGEEYKNLFHWQKVGKKYEKAHRDHGDNGSNGRNGDKKKNTEGKQEEKVNI